MAKLIIHKSLVDDEILLEKTVSEVTTPTLSRAIHECDMLQGNTVLAFVNKRPVHVDDWRLFKLEPGDEIDIVSEMHDPVSAIFATFAAAVGTGVAIKTGLAGFAFWAYIVKAAAIGYSIGALTNAVVNPSTPLIQNDDPNYGWDGARLVMQPDGPVSVTYGQYLIGGNLIMQYVSSDGTNNYLHMLINLGEGEIEGIMKEDLSGTLSEEEGGEIPYILVNGQPFSNFEDFNYTYRLGTPNQGIMNGFGDTKTFFSDGRKIVRDTPVVYTTTGVDINGFTLQLTVPGLYHAEDDGTLSWLPLEFTVEYRLNGGGAYTLLGNVFGATGTGAEPSKTTVYTYVSFSNLGQIKDVADEGTASASSIALTHVITRPVLFQDTREDRLVEISNTTFFASQAFNNKNTDFGDEWRSAATPTGGSPIWLKYDLGSGESETVIKYRIQAAYSPENGRDAAFPSDWTFQGSNNNSDWTTLDTQTSQEDPGHLEWAEYSFSNAVAYRYHRILITGRNGSHTYVAIGEFIMQTLESQGGVLDPGKYDIRITRLTDDYTGFRDTGDLYLSGVTEITTEDHAYRNSVLLGLRLKATDQLSGTTPNILTMIRGRKVSVPKLTVAAATQVYDDCYYHDGDSEYKLIDGDDPCTDTGDFVTQWTRHSIWCTRDFLLNKRYGLGEYHDSTSFDDVVGKSEAKYCWELVDDLNGGTEHRFQMNINLGAFTTGPEMLKMLARNFRGWIIWSANKWKPVVDKARDPVQLFNMSNIVPNSLKTNYLPMSKTHNLVEAQYADPERVYNIHTTEVVARDDWTAVRPLRKLTFNAKGTTDVGQILRDSKYVLNCDQICNKLIQFNAELDSVHCETGDVVRFQNDLTATGQGGRVVSAAAGSIVSNVDIVIGAGTHYIRIRLPNGDLETETITTGAATVRKIAISGSFTTTPLVDAIFTVGLVDVDSVPFKVISMTRTEFNDVEISALIESDNKYVDTTDVFFPEPRYTTLPNLVDPPKNVTDLVVTQLTDRPGIVVSFNIPQEDLAFHHADIHLSVNSSSDALLRVPFKSGITNNTDFEISGVLPGTTYYIAVISYNRVGIRNPVPMTALKKVTWTEFTPPQITGLRLEGETRENRIALKWTGREPTFVWNKVSTISGAGHQPAGQEGLGAGEFYDETYYKYWIEIWIQGRQIPGPPIITTDSKYTFQYISNYIFSRGILQGTNANSKVTIKVWAYNAGANIKSINSTELRVTNTTPVSPTGLEVVPSAGGVSAIWDDSAEADHSHYQVRTTITGAGAGDWIDLDDNTYTRVMSASEVDTYGAAVLITVEIRDVDLFGNTGSIISSTATANQVLDTIFKLSISKSGASGVAAELLDKVLHSGGLTFTS